MVIFYFSKQGDEGGNKLNCDYFVIGGLFYLYCTRSFPFFDGDVDDVVVDCCLSKNGYCKRNE